MLMLMLIRAVKSLLSVLSQDVKGNISLDSTFLDRVVFTLIHLSHIGLGIRVQVGIIPVRKLVRSE